MELDKAGVYNKKTLKGYRGMRNRSISYNDKLFLHEINWLILKIKVNFFARIRMRFNYSGSIFCSRKLNLFNFKYLFRNFYALWQFFKD